MSDENLRDLTLEKRIYLRKGHLSVEGKICVGGIEFNPDRGKWMCFFSISEISPEKGKIYGDDPFSSLVRCIECVKGLVIGSIEDGWQIWSIYEGDNAGF